MVTSSEDRTIQLANVINAKENKKETITIRNNPQKGNASIVIEKGHNSAYFDLSTAQLEMISKKLQEWFQVKTQKTVVVEKKKFKLF